MCKKGKGHSYAYECPKGNGWHLTSMKPKSQNVVKLKRKGHSYRNKERFGRRNFV